jgi:solute carrier family 25 phosphate transporter 23/24/25/41
MARRIYHEGGARAFFRGNGTNVLKIAPESAAKFFVYEEAKRIFCSDPNDISILQRLSAGATAGVASQLLIYPLETVKTRLSVSPSGTYRGISHCLTTVVRQEGPAALFRGLAPSLLGIVPYAGVDLGIFSFLKEHYIANHPQEEPSVLLLLGCGAVSSTCGQLVSYPLALVRTKMQSQGIGGKTQVYSNMFDCFGKTVQSDGLPGLYRGILPNFLKSVPAISITYVIYEKTKVFLQKMV